MLGATPIAAVLGSGVDPTDHTAIRSYLRHLCHAGLSVMFIIPGTKRPFDGRTPRKRLLDDKAAREQAKQEGRRDYDKVKSASGLALATNDIGTLTKYLTEYENVYGPDCAVSLAVEVGGSRLVVVDCDTVAQKNKFLDVAAKANEVESLDIPPTVISPGSMDDEGNWIHEPGNGHYWFTVPEGVELPTNVGATTWGGEDGFAVLWDRRYVLIPPSERKEGRYELLGQDYPLPTWLKNAIDNAASARASRSSLAAADTELAGDIDAWSETVSWADILEPLGWTPVGRPDNCGCDVWTAPGDHASPKSATAHAAGCSLGRYTETNAPLHIWTDHDTGVFDTWVDDKGNQIKTISKLQAVAVSQYEGSLHKAMDALDLSQSLTEIEKAEGVSSSNMDDPDASTDAGEDFDLPVHDEDDDPQLNPDVFDTDIDGMPVIAPFSHWRHMPPPEYVVDGLIEHGGLSCIIGPPGVGKSSVALDIACHIAVGKPWQGNKTLKTRVLYLPGEGLSGAIQRVKAWAHIHDVPDNVMDEGLRMGNAIIQLQAKNEAWSALADYVIRQQIGLIIFDTFARMALGMEENSATEVGKAVKRFDKMRVLTNAGVLVVHHTTKANPTVARGSSALMGALDSELLVSDGMWDFDEFGANNDGRVPAGRKLQLATTKQKNAEQREHPMALLMRSNEEYNAPYITGPHGEIDPMLGDVTLARPVEETILETAIRIKAFVAELTEQGATRGEIANGVRPDAYTLLRSDTAKAWKQKVALAVDRGLRYGLLETASGQRMGARYVEGPVSSDTARQNYSAEVMKDDDAE